ncbi:MAG: hypothetical protein AAF517_08285 [Planctomycetota bacterium]
MSPSQVTIEVIWQDDDMVEVKACATNSEFSGETRVYTVYEDLKSLADELQGFPRNTSHEVRFEAGVRSRDSYFGIRFYCFDNAAHTAAQVQAESNVPTEFRREEKHAVTLEVHFEPSAVDEFAAQLRRLVESKSGSATLVGVGPNTRNIP